MESTLKKEIAQTFLEYDESETEDIYNCKVCGFELIDENVKPFCFPCSDLICERCFIKAKMSDNFTCPECDCNYTKKELEKIKFNKEILKIILNWQTTIFLYLVSIFIIIHIFVFS